MTMLDEDELEVLPRDPDKSYGLMAVVEGETPAVGKEPEDTVLTWPHLIMAELAAAMVALILLHGIATMFNAPLEEIADPGHTPNPAKAPWYFLGLQEMVSWTTPFIGGILIPGLAVGFLLLLPFIDRKLAGSGQWFAPQRRLATMFVLAFVIGSAILVFIGTFCRGPNWGFYWPWESWPKQH